MGNEHLTNWRTLLTSHMTLHGETLADIVSNTMTDEDMDIRFDNGFGGTEGAWFTVWTDKRVYFPTCYDGSEWVESVSRHPDGQATAHVGGG
jgi:hypothetical protein